MKPVSRSTPCFLMGRVYSLTNSHTTFDMPRESIFFFLFLLFFSFRKLPPSTYSLVLGHWVISLRWTFRPKRSKSILSQTLPLRIINNDYIFFRLFFTTLYETIRKIDAKRLLEPKRKTKRRRNSIILKIII